MHANHIYIYIYTKREFEKELKFASAPITLSITNTIANKTASQTSVVNIYDKQQNAQIQFKYKDTGVLDFIMKSDDIIKIKKGQPLVLSVKTTGVKKNVPFDVSVSGNFTTLNIAQDEEHDENGDRKQRTVTLFYPLSTQTTDEYIAVNLSVGGVMNSVVVRVVFEELK